MPMLKGVEVVVVAEAWEVGQGTVVGNHRAAVGEVVGLGVDLVIASRMGNVLAGRTNSRCLKTPANYTTTTMSTFWVRDF